MKKILSIGVIMLILGVAFGVYMYNKPHQKMTSMRSDLHLSATQLFTDYETNEATANSKYLDKVIEVKGKVKEVSTDDTGNTSITLESGSDLFGVVCQMDNLTEHDRNTFKEGEEVTFKGICTGALMDVVLVRCIEVS